MATVIDAFVATLSLDGRLFRRGAEDAERSRRRLDDANRRGDTEQERRERTLADAQRRRQQQQDTRVKGTVDGYRRIRNELLALAAIFTAGVGIKDFISETINSAANLGYLSANLKLSTQELTSWQRASERAGGSAGGIIAQLKESQDTLAQLKSGMGPNEGLQSFFRWGGNPDDLKDGNTYLLARSRIIHDMFNVDPAQAALIAKSMGISDDQFNFIKQGPAAVMDLVHAQEKNAAVTMKDAEAALALRNKVLDLRDSLQSTATRIILQMAPSIELLFAKLEKGAQWVADHKEDIARWVSISITAIEKFVVMADKFATAVGGWQNVLMGLASVPIISGLGAIATAIGAIAAAGASIPVIVAGLAALAAYGGYKGAEYLFGDKKAADPKGDALRKGHAAILRGGVGNAKPTTKAEMAAEAARQKGGVGGSAAGGNNASIAMQKLKDMGWTPEQAAGIVGSFMQESGMDHTAVNPTSGAYGIGQWLGSRRTDFTKLFGHSIVGSSLEEQLAFFDHEVTEGKEGRAGRLLHGAKTAEDAARIHSEAYERPGTAEANIARRQRLAAQLASADRMGNAAAVGAMPAGAAASAAAAGRSNTNTSTVSIDKIEVVTQATDAAGIAAALRPAVQQYTFTNQANSGMQ
jgi:hypothetical protein